MKILEVLHTYMAQSTLYIGNEFSPDPLDMLERVKAIYPQLASKEAFEREIVLNTDNKVLDDQVQQDVINLLTKNGYVEYNPCTVIIDCEL
ncbi:hypothetical protein [Escherichia phage vB_EcoM_JNE01]|nr:hypothetical protein [Escherichia phage vB_EcoM_JNE01]